MIFHGRLSDRNYGCRQRPRYLIFSQFSIGPILLPKCVCLRGSALDPTGGFQRPQLANVGSHHSRGPHRIAGPRAPRPHDPPLAQPQRNIDAAQMLVHCQRRSLSIVAEVMSSSPHAISARPLLAASVAPYALGCDERSTHANIQHVENPRRGCHVVESSRPILRWYQF